MNKCIIAFESKVILELLAKMLETFGMKPIAFSNGKEALDYFYTNKDEVNLIIVSYAISGIDGIDILHKIRSENKTTPKIIISSPVSNQYQMAESLGSGADDYLIKPFDEEILASKLRILGLL